MEFFEKAHVYKKPKPTKSDDKVKKQLKQMLYGYKHNDNQTIKNSELRRDTYDDTVSVSSFSEFDHTNTDEHTEGDTTRDVSTADIKDVSLSDIDYLSVTQESDAKPGKSDELEMAEVKSMESLSDYEDTIQSISDESFEEKSSSIEETDNKSTTSITSTEEDSNSPFDLDGALAAEILKKLGKKSKQESVIPKISKKRELEQDVNEDVDIEKMEGLFISEENLRVDTPSSLYDGLSLDGSSSDAKSPAYVSVEHTELHENLSDILSGYRHSTVRNLPSEGQNYDTNELFPASPIHSPYIIDDDNASITAADSLVEDESDFSVENLDDTEVSTSLQLDEQSMDCTDNQVETLQSETLHDTETSLDETLDTSLTTPVKVYYAKKSCIFVLKHPAQIYIHGKVKVIPLGGTAEVFGYTVTELCEVFAPTTNFAQCLQTIQTENDYYGLFGKLTSSGLAVAEAEEIVTTLGQFDAVVRLLPFKSNKIDFVEEHFNVTDLFSKPSKHIDNYLKKASEILGCSLYLTRPWRCIEINSSWDQVLKHGMNSQSKGIVCGGKGTGKSTFLRYYVNRLLARGPVLVVDLDPGQCEFTPAGSVAATVVTKPLLGPNFTHLTRPDRMLNIGMINVMDNLRRYAKAVTSLITFCASNEQYRRVPWIINTMGLCNTMGLKLMTLIITHSQPTFLLQMDSKNAKNRYECYLNPQAVSTFYAQREKTFLFKDVRCAGDLNYAFFVSHQLTEGAGKWSNYSMAPRDGRYLNFLAYFGELMDMHKGLDFLEITPYEVPLQYLSIGSNVKLAAGAVTRAINGKVVALCEQNEQTAAARESRAGGVFALADKPLLCHGHGLIRGIDGARGIVYMVTPVPFEVLSRVDCLVYADWVPELRGHEAALPRGTAVPYRMHSLHHQRQLLFAPRRRFNPIQLLKMSRSS